jgi:hypothetical protein
MTTQFLLGPKRSIKPQFVALRAVPANVLRRRKAGSVNREVTFDCLEGQSALSDEALQVRGQLFHFEVVDNAVVAGNASDVAANKITTQSGTGMSGVTSSA